MKWDQVGQVGQGISTALILGLFCIRPPDKSVYWKTIFFISHPKHMLWVLKRTVSMFKLMDKKIIAIVCSLKLLIRNYVHAFFPC